MQQSTTQQTSHRSQKTTLGVAFSLAGAILILLRGLLRIIVGDVIAFVGSDEVRSRFIAGLALNIVGGLAIVFAVLIMIGTYLIYRRKEITGGGVVLIFSLLSIFVGSGWLIGLILGIVGGILGLLKK